MENSRIDLNQVENINIPTEWESWKEISEKASLYDLIEINRGLYQHWVMYLDNGNIVHVTQVDGRTEGDKAEKRTDKLKTIARDDLCRINNHEGTATLKGLKRKENKEIFESVADVIQKNDSYQIVPYGVNSVNCEFYATSWKYGEGFSMQVERSSILKDIPPEVLSASMAAVQDVR